MHPLLVLLHVLSVLGFLLAHGASAAVMFRVHRESDVARLQALLDLSQDVGIAMAVAAAALFVSGIAAGFTGQWWGRGWIWASLGLFLAISAAMSGLGRLYFERIRRALAEHQAGVQSGSAEQGCDLAAVLATGRPKLLAGIGLGGLAAITWLMVLKPF